MATKPGAPQGGSGGAPSDFSYGKYERTSQNPQISRMPTTQQEWNRFIYELEKIVRNETNGFTPTFTGFSSDPSTPFVWWHRYGQIVFMQFHFTTGTSNSGTFRIDNLPEEITPSTTQFITPFYGLINNGAEVVGLQDSGFVTIGDKGLNTTPTMDDSLSITYFLREPNKT
jgi:hypothetical protein